MIIIDSHNFVFTFIYFLTRKRYLANDCCNESELKICIKLNVWQSDSSLKKSDYLFDQILAPHGQNI